MLNFCVWPCITGMDITTNPHVGELFFIDCTGDGIPSPNIVWVKDGMPLESIANEHVYVF